MPTRTVIGQHISLADQPPHETIRAIRIVTRYHDLASYMAPAQNYPKGSSVRCVAPRQNARALPAHATLAHRFPNLSPKLAIPIPTTPQTDCPTLARRPTFACDMAYLCSLVYAMGVVFKRWGLPAPPRFPSSILYTYLHRRHTSLILTIYDRPS